MISWLSILIEECKCITEHWKCILLGVVILIIIILLALRSKFFDDIV